MSFLQRCLLITAAVTVLFSAYREATTHNCVSQCYTNVSLEKISDLKRQMIDYTYIHPHFLLEEYLEKLHRDKFCRSINLEAENTYCEDNQSQLVGNITANVTKYSTFLNKNRKSSPCSSAYHINYDPDRYPRYVVEVQCGNPNDKITLGSLMYLNLRIPHGLLKKTMM